MKTKKKNTHCLLTKFWSGGGFVILTACRPSSIEVSYDHVKKKVCITVPVGFNDVMVPQLNSLELGSLKQHHGASQTPQIVALYTQQF